MNAVNTGALIAEIRKEKGLTQSDLAGQLHVSIQAVSKWERGLNFPDITLIEPIAQILELTVSELMAGQRDAQPQDELVRDSLHAGLLQLLPRLKKWRRLFYASAALLLTLCAWMGCRFVQENTRLLPQTQTVITPRAATPGEQMAADLADSGSNLCFFDVTYADGTTEENLELELWTDGQLIRTWELASARDPSPWPRRETVGISLNSLSGQFRCGAALHAGLWNSGPKDVPGLENGYGMNFLQETTVVDPEHGVVLACFALTNAAGQWKAPIWVGNISAPSAETGFTFLLLRLSYRSQ